MLCCVIDYALTFTTIATILQLWARSTCTKTTAFGSCKYSQSEQHIKQSTRSQTFEKRRGHRLCASQCHIRSEVVRTDQPRAILDCCDHCFFNCFRLRASSGSANSAHVHSLGSGVPAAALPYDQLQQPYCASTGREIKAADYDRFT